MLELCYVRANRIPGLALVKRWLSDALFPVFGDTVAGSDDMGTCGGAAKGAEESNRHSRSLWSDGNE